MGCLQLTEFFKRLGGFALGEEILRNAKQCATRQLVIGKGRQELTVCLRRSSEIALLLLGVCDEEVGVGRSSRMRIGGDDITPLAGIARHGQKRGGINILTVLVEKPCSGPEAKSDHDQPQNDNETSMTVPEKLQLKTAFFDDLLLGRRRLMTLRRHDLNLLQRHGLPRRGPYSDNVRRSSRPR